MSPLLLYRLDDALDRHVLVADSAPLIALLASREMSPFEDARALAGQLLGSATARASSRVNRRLHELRELLADQLQKAADENRG